MDKLSWVEPPYSKLVENWITILKAVQLLDGDILQLNVEKPATESEIQHLEAQMGRPLESSLRKILSEFSHSITFHWRFRLTPKIGSPKNTPYRYYEGGFHLSLNELKAISDLYQDGLADGYDWENIMPFLAEEDDNDFVAIDLATETGEIIYLTSSNENVTYDHIQINKHCLGKNLQTFLHEWSRIGCVGLAFFDWIDFLDSETGYISSHTQASKLWLDALGVNLNDLN